MYVICVVIVCSMYSPYESAARVTQLELNKESKLEFFDDNKGGVIVFESNDGVLKIKCSKDNKEDVTCNLNYDFAMKSGSNIYIFSTLNKEATIWSYSITKNQISAPSTYSLDMKSENDIAILKGGKVFFLSRFSSKNIFSFISGKPKISGTAMTSKVRSIRSNPSGSFIYVQLDDELGTVKVYDKTFSKKELGILSNTICCDFEFVSDNLILDSDGNLFLKKVDSEFDFEKICSVSLGTKDKYKCFCKNYLITSGLEGCVKLFDLTNPDVPKTYECEGEVVYLSSYKDRVVLVEKIKGEFILKEIDVDDIVTPVEENFVPKSVEIEESIENLKQDVVEKSNGEDTKENDVGNIVIPTNEILKQDDVVEEVTNIANIENSEEEKVKNEEVILDKEETENVSTDFDKSVENLITSNVYDIDLDRFVIKNVKFGTTLSKFNKNISLNGTDLKFIKNDKVINSGKVGTGTTLEFKDPENKIQKFTIVVKGDVTGSGNVSSIDMREIYKHIFKNKLLEGFYLEAADINDDGKVDTLDLLAVHKLMN